MTDDECGAPSTNSGNILVIPLSKPGGGLTGSSDKVYYSSD
jgi:hypothetical protein